MTLRGQSNATTFYYKNSSCLRNKYKGFQAIHIMKNTIDLQWGEFAGSAALRKQLTRAAVQKWVNHALNKPGEITVRIVGEAEAQAMNLQFRGKAYATNVLTFDYTQEPVVSADLVLCAPVVQQEATEQNKALVTHYAHLIVHGTLHAQGYDHETNERDALEMETLEILLLGALNIANPY